MFAMRTNTFQKSIMLGIAHESRTEIIYWSTLRAHIARIQSNMKFSCRTNVGEFLLLIHWLVISPYVQSNELICGLRPLEIRQQFLVYINFWLAELFVRMMTNTSAIQATMARPEWNFLVFYGEHKTLSLNVSQIE